MNKFLWVIVGILLTVSVIIFGIILSLLGSILATPNYYRAAVLEIVPYRNESSSVKEVVWRNLQTYNDAASIASENGVDIIVFPENILYSPGNKTSELIGSVAEDIPDPKLSNYNPCEEEDQFQNQPILRNLSCLAKFGRMYVVANMIDFKKREDHSAKYAYYKFDFLRDINSSKGDFYLFNANVVFNREGKFVAKYHKRHLIFERSIDPSKVSDDGYFETEFGKFITTTFMDLSYSELIESIRKTKALNIAYPTYWYDHTPRFFANSFQQAFAFTNNINLLAANGHVHSTGTLGSGIYSGSNGPLINTYSPDSCSKILISNVPKNPKLHNKNFDLNRKKYILMDNSYMEEGIEERARFNIECESSYIDLKNDSYESYKCFPSNLTEYAVRKLEKRADSLNLCSNSLCCSLTYKALSMYEDYFFIVVNNTSNFYNVSLYEFEACFVTRCKSKDEKHCNQYLLKSKTMFEEVKLKGNFSSKYVYPKAVDSNSRLTKLDEWSFDGVSEIKYKSIKNNSLLFLGLTRRTYKTDKSYNKSFS